VVNVGRTIDGKRSVPSRMEQMTTGDGSVGLPDAGEKAVTSRAISDKKTRGEGTDDTDVVMAGDVVEGPSDKDSSSGNERVGVLPGSPTSATKSRKRKNPPPGAAPEAGTTQQSAKRKAPARPADGDLSQAQYPSESTMASATVTNDQNVDASSVSDGLLRSPVNSSAAEARRSSIRLRSRQLVGSAPSSTRILARELTAGKYRADQLGATSVTSSSPSISSLSMDASLQPLPQETDDAVLDPDWK